MEIFIETPRLILREILETDVEGMYQLNIDPEVLKYIGLDPLKNRNEALEQIQHVRKQYVENGIGRWAIIEKSTNDFVGWTGLKYEQEVWPNFNYYDLGYRLRRAHWGKGIATETAIISLKYGFSTLNIDEICAGAHINNIASNRILQKVGLKFIEKFEPFGLPHNWYKITKTEWEETNTTK